MWNNENATFCLRYPGLSPPSVLNPGITAFLDKFRCGNKHMKTCKGWPGSGSPQSRMPEMWTLCVDQDRSGQPHRINRTISEDRVLCRWPGQWRMRMRWSKCPVRDPAACFTSLRFDVNEDGYALFKMPLKPNNGEGKAPLRITGFFQKPITIPWISNYRKSNDNGEITVFVQQLNNNSSNRYIRVCAQWHYSWSRPRLFSFSLLAMYAKDNIDL